ncbi:L7Ae/L30e/S12e/Gadd45 family ribosomal protein [Candidatus Xianfuyuplasma coldseepsis]|uniref:Ribosomal protein eL8/eL30/eS12/Gadd45 domain-containing protein n=1 Tax=Candidatus Xianfuyuplasma coldseepsis TaxID=2782163 RepID=A0A7L7KPA0_9MOLU|nr:ribosomal L7Ae/L30e/S12e/Gadd45 family protein [Xianfuyuplasma coldseepsis]QMS84365.1 hypothetical protein G4Z02_00935 [Xianfuyuplasma coldseepsis]
MNLLGLALRARKLLVGENLVLPACHKHPGNVVFLASDAGENITKKITNKATSFGLTIVQSVDSDALSQALGKEHVKVVLITDKGFSNTCKDYLM